MNDLFGRPDVASQRYRGRDQPALLYLKTLMYGGQKRQLRVTLALAAALLLRAAIPAGYMPSSGEDGLWFEFCPDGVPAGFMQLLAGESAPAHHGHGDDADDAGHDHDEHQCPVGHILLSAATVDSDWQAEPAPVVTAFGAPSTRILSGTTRVLYLSRGPPA
jgi:hypothetical protein